MNRRFPLLLAVVAAVVVVLWIVSRRHDQPGPVPSTTMSTVPLRVPPPPPLPATRTVLPVAGSTTRLNDPAETPEEDLATVDLLVTEFRRVFSQNPVGENEEITASLTGRNAKGLVFLPADCPHIDGEGRLLDRWGSPYFFHAIAADRLEITSAGPDRQFHTADDISLDH